jgi:mannose-6-phosphate isomerase-like protein (cupin superfamily)
MKHDQHKFTKGFRVSVGKANSQAAVMVLGAGDTEGGPDNRHRGADRWLIVTEGTGAATVNGRKLELKTGTIVLIEAGDRYTIRRGGCSLLHTPCIRESPNPYDATGASGPSFVGAAVGRLASFCSGMMIVQVRPSGRKSRVTFAMGKPCSIKSEPNPRRFGSRTGGPSCSRQKIAI